MGVSDILTSIDREIALLKQVRSLLTGSAIAEPKKVGRPKKSAIAVAAPAAATTVAKKRKKRQLSPEGRKRIADAAKRRWEAQRKAAPSK